jgi:hypothetical protein
MSFNRKQNSVWLYRKDTLREIRVSPRATPKLILFFLNRSDLGRSRHDAATCTQLQPLYYDRIKNHFFYNCKFHLIKIKIYIV